MLVFIYLQKKANNIFKYEKVCRNLHQAFIANA
jgi:hypothetical protein